MCQASDRPEEVEGDEDVVHESVDIFDAFVDVSPPYTCGRVVSRLRPTS
jgi:hypothetical protein